MYTTWAAGYSWQIASYLPGPETESNGPIKLQQDIRKSTRKIPKFQTQELSSVHIRGQKV